MLNYLATITAVNLARLVREKFEDMQPLYGYDVIVAVRLGIALSLIS